MTFIEEHFEYVFKTATGKAVEIARATGMWQEVDDFRQDLIAAIITRMPCYDQTKSTPKTFIAMCIGSAKKDLLDKLFRDKRRVNMKSCALAEDHEERQEDATVALYPEACECLPTKLCEICRAIMSGQSVASIAHALGVPKRRIMRAILHDVPMLLRQ